MAPKQKKTGFSFKKMQFLQEKFQIFKTEKKKWNFTISQDKRNPVKNNKNVAKKYPNAQTPIIVFKTKLKSTNVSLNPI